MKINVQDVISIIFLVIGVVSYLASVLKKVDTKHARMWEDIENTATNLVAQQNTTDKSGANKKADATAELIKQAKELGHDKITESVAKGAIENAVNKLNNNPTEDVQISTNGLDLANKISDRIDSQKISGGEIASTTILDDVQPIKE